MSTEANNKEDDPQQPPTKKPRPTPYLSRPSVRAMDSGTLEEIVSVAEQRGGSGDLVRDQLGQVTIRRSHNPVAYSGTICKGRQVAGAVPLHTAPPFRPKNKISIVGCGQVGLAIAFALLNQGTVGALAMVDVDKSKLEGEVMDLRQGSAFYSRVRIDASDQYDITSNSDLIILTAGTARRPGETRLDLVGRNASIVKSIVPKILQHSPHAPICVVSNPCDVMTAVASKAAGPDVPPGQIFGSGTALDSSRLRSLIGATFDVETSSVYGFVIGEHGDSSVPVWSSIRIGGVPLIKPGEEPSQVHRAIHAEVVTAGAQVIQKKGHTNWAIGLSLACIAKAVVNDERNFLPVSTCVRGYIDGLEEDVFLSLPCCVGATGVVRVIDLDLTELEAEAFRTSAKEVWKVQKEVWEDGKVSSKL